MTLPVPITFRLPGDAWVPRAPEDVGVAHADFLATRAVDDGSGYHPVLTIAGGDAEHASLTAIADDSLTTLRAQAADVRLVARQEIGTDAAPGINQVLSCVATAEGRTFDLRQGQCVLAMTDVEDPTQRAVVLFTVTCTAAQAPLVLPEFEQFLATVKVDQ
jgi:hypothetical protein